MTPCDVAIIGSGIGGASVAAALAPTGKRIVVLERGQPMAPSPMDREPDAVFARGDFRTQSQWFDGKDRLFRPGNYHVVGGNSKMYGAVMLRFREEDFTPREHLGGTTRGWPFAAAEISPFYDQAEYMFKLRGSRSAEDAQLAAYPFPPVPHEPAIAALATRLANAGLTPQTLPLAVDLPQWLRHGAQPWDGFPNTRGGKIDAETGPLAQALSHENVTLRTGAKVARLAADPSGNIDTITLESGEIIKARTVVLAAGAINSAALLLASQDETHPKGLANRSDQVGRNFMNHNCTAVLAIDPRRKNTAIYQKTLMFNDFYHSDGQGGGPLGNVQMLGKIPPAALQASARLPRSIARFIAARSFDFYAMSEDLPRADSRVTLECGRVKLDWRRSNWEAHQRLVKRFKSCLRRAGFPVVLARAFDHRAPSHQCGTARMGDDPRTSVVNPFGRAHDHPNLFIADASIFPTSAAVNPALTIAAVALRTAHHIKSHDLGATKSAAQTRQMA